MKSDKCLAGLAILLGTVLTGCVTSMKNHGSIHEPPVNPHPRLLVWIKPGTFMMGSPSTEPQRMDTEAPGTRVTITQGFWMSKYETTQEEYQAVMGNNPSHFTGDLNRPVEHVFWDDATNYCGHLTAQERAAGRLPAGYAYRLPRRRNGSMRAGRERPRRLAMGRIQI